MKEKKSNELWIHGSTSNFLKDYAIYHSIKLNEILRLDDFIELNFPIGRYILNYDSVGRGTHFVALICFLDPKNEYTKTCFLCDGFGTEPPKILKDTAKNMNIPLYYSNIDKMKITDENCGIWALGFLSLSQHEKILTLESLNKSLKILKDYEIK